MWSLELISGRKDQGIPLQQLWLPEQIRTELQINQRSLCDMHPSIYHLFIRKTSPRLGPTLPAQPGLQSHSMTFTLNSLRVCTARAFELPPLAAVESRTRPGAGLMLREQYAGDGLHCASIDDATMAVPPEIIKKIEDGYTKLQVSPAGHSLVPCELWIFVAGELFLTASPGVICLLEVLTLSRRSM